MDLRDTILTYVEREHGVRPRDDTRLLEEGIMDSTNFILFIGFLEQQFGIDISADDLTEENFADILTTIRYVETQIRRRGVVA